MGAPRVPDAACRDGRVLSLGPRRVGLGQHVLLGGRAGGVCELEGVLLRLARCRQLDHRRQDARLPLGDGHLGADLRRELVEHPRPAGARGRRGGGRALCDGSPLVLARGRADRGLGARDHTVAAFMFRFNNPDALLVLLLTGAAYALTRALEHGSTRWLVFAFSLVGFGFLAKMLQALIVLPAFALVYLFAGPRASAAGSGSSCSAGSRCSRRRDGGSRSCSSPGFESSVRRRFADEQLLQPHVRVQRLWPPHRERNRQRRRRRAGGGSQWGPTGLTRLFNADFGGQISWLLPAALLLLAAGIAVTWNRPRTDRTRAALMLWGGWLLITAVLFSFGQGHHPSLLHDRARTGRGRRRRDRRGHALVAPRVFAQCARAGRRARGHCRVVVQPARARRRVGIRGSARLAIGGFVVVVAMLAWPYLPRRSAPVVAIAAVPRVALLGPGAYTVATAATAHGGAIPSAGPAGASRSGPGGFGTRRVRSRGRRGTPGRCALPGGGSAVGPQAGGRFAGWRCRSPDGRRLRRAPTAGAGRGGAGGLGGLERIDSQRELKKTLNVDHADTGGSRRRSTPTAPRATSSRPVHR